MILESPQKRFNNSPKVKVQQKDQPTWNAWTPYDGNLEVINKLIESWSQKRTDQDKRIRDQAIPDKVKKSWRDLLVGILPNRSTNSLIFTYDRGSASIIPSNVYVKKSGCGTTDKSWNTLCHDLLFEPITRLVLLEFEFIRLLEIRKGTIIEVLRLPANTSPRMVDMRRFIGSMLRIYRTDPGPIVVMGCGDGKMELDCWLLSGYVPIQACYKLSKKENLDNWWNSIQKQGYDRVWKNKWNEWMYDQSCKNNSYTSDRKMILSAIRNKRLKSIFIPEDADARKTIPAHFVHNFILNNIHIYPSPTHVISGIITHNHHTMI
jgi:hypothetical protein